MNLKTIWQRWSRWQRVLLSLFLALTLYFGSYFAVGNRFTGRVDGHIHFTERQFPNSFVAYAFGPAALTELVAIRILPKAFMHEGLAVLQQRLLIRTSPEDVVMVLP